jgi:PhnB protein
MSAVHIPPGYNQVMPYLILDDPERFFEFTKTVFDAVEKSRHTDATRGLVHGEVLIGKACIMFGGRSGDWPPMTSGLFVYVSDADAYFTKAIGAGATVVMELTNQEYGRTCGVKDPCGNTWWITSTKP